jgi:hypothetical protein
MPSSTAVCSGKAHLEDRAVLVVELVEQRWEGLEVLGEGHLGVVGAGAVGEGAAGVGVVVGVGSAYEVVLDCGWGSGVVSPGFPFGTACLAALRAIDRWARAYRCGGFAALVPEARKAVPQDAGGGAGVGG